MTNCAAPPPPVSSAIRSSCSAQVKRMLADPKARRLSTEFFGQWLGFYHFDQFRGVDTGRFPEFTDEVKSSMYDEAVSFFEHVIRKDRPVREMLFADYDFLNQPLAKFYGVKHEIKSTGPVELVEGAGQLPARRTAASGRHPHRHLRAAAHQSREARRLGAAPDSGNARSAAARRCRQASGRRQRLRRTLPARKTRSPQAQCRPAPTATCASTRSASRWSTTIPPAAGARNTPTASRLTIPAFSATRRRSPASRDCSTISRVRKIRCAARWPSSWSAMRWAARCRPSDQLLIDRMVATRRQRHILAIGGGDRHQPPVPQPAGTRRRPRLHRGQDCRV